MGKADGLESGELGVWPVLRLLLAGSRGRFFLSCPLSSSWPAEGGVCNSSARFPCIMISQPGAAQQWLWSTGHSLRAGPVHLQRAL